MKRIFFFTGFWLMFVWCVVTIFWSTSSGHPGKIFHVSEPLELLLASFVIIIIFIIACLVGLVGGVTGVFIGRVLEFFAPKRTKTKDNS